MAEHNNLRIVMFPYLAYGHLSPFLELAKRLSDRGGFTIDLYSTPINLSFIKNKIPPKYSSSIHLVELLLDLPELPPHYHTTNGLPHHLNLTLFRAFKMAKPQFHQILKDKKPDVLIYDTLIQWAPFVASTLNIPSINFYISNVAQCCYFAHSLYRPGEEFPFPALYLTDYDQKKAADSVMVDIVEEMPDKSVALEYDGLVVLLVNSSRAIDGKYYDYFSGLAPGKATKALPIGAQVQQDSITNVEEYARELFKWLEGKSNHSTVYISFGSENFLSREEMEEMAYGLELSNVNFIWVVRFPRGEEKVKLEEALPNGFLERIGEKGWIVEGWAPQARILKHPSVGAFLSHCGWNSILESIEFGVPVIALPMLYDQPLNARLIVEAGVAVEIARDETGKFHRGEISKNIKDVIFEERKGEDLRSKVKVMGENVRLLREEEMDGVVEAITQVCEESRSKNVAYAV